MNTPPNADGYQALTSNGPKVRTDVVDVYVFRVANAADERARGHDWDEQGSARRARLMFLQVLRASEPLKATWHPVMGHVERGETAVQCALREMREELGLDPRSPQVRGAWALEQVHPFYIAAIDTIVMSPRFAVEVDGAWTARLNHEHSAARWVHQDDAPGAFMWPGQRAAVAEIIDLMAHPGRPAAGALRIQA